jgi:UDP:flavonoid glycosyltransferase YjiC (YdhE family)
MVITADPKPANSDNNGTSIKKPRILACASQATGHTTPVLNIVRELIGRGYKITFIAGQDFQDSIKEAGATAIDIGEMMTEDLLAIRNKIPVGLERLGWELEQFFVRQMPPRMEVVYKVLEEMRAEDPDSEIVILTETFFLGTLPLYLGAPLPKGFTKRPRIVNIHAAGYLATSVDSPPAGMGLLPPTTDEERATNVAMHKAALEGPFSPLLDLEVELFREAGAVDHTRQSIFDTWTASHDIVLHMCPPSLEFPRSDLHPKVNYVGALGPRPLRKDLVLPDFWNEVTAGDKRIVTVTQGTVSFDYNNLIMPTMRALADRSDLLVVGILGTKGSSLPADFELPSNARVVDYLPYDAILKHTSVYVMNAGYGGFIHGVANGVPLIMAGTTEDKPDVAARGEYSGVAVNLRTSSPSEDQIREALDKILTDTKYKKRVLEIQRENEELKAMETVEKTILEMAATA